MSQAIRRAFAVLGLALLAAFPLPAAEKPSLVIVISVDQMRADYLERFRPWFGARGFNRFLKEGAVYTRAAQRHAVTFTAPGHASIGSGLDPRDHGIIGNRWFDTELGTSVYCTEVRETSPVPPFRPERSRSPAPLLPCAREASFWGTGSRNASPHHASWGCR